MDFSLVETVNLIAGAMMGWAVSGLFEWWSARAKARQHAEETARAEQRHSQIIAAVERAGYQVEEQRDVAGRVTSTRIVQVSPVTAAMGLDVLPPTIRMEPTAGQAPADRSDE